MKTLNIFDRSTLYYFSYTSPIFIIFMIWAALEFKGVANPAKLNGGAWDVFGWFFIAWVFSLIYIVTKMIGSKKLREVVLNKLAGVVDRDERESLVSGNAAKFSFLSTFALLLFMLVFSVTNIQVSKDPSSPKENKGLATIGFGAKLIDDSAIVLEKKSEDEFKFNYSSLPLSKPFIIILLMVWQLGSYHLVARRELKIQE